MSAKAKPPRSASRFDKFIEVNKEAADEKYRDFEIGLARAALRLNPRRVDAMMMLGHALTHRRQHRQALAVDRKLASLCPDDPIVHYNLACSLSNLGELDESIKALGKSLDLGYRDVPYMMTDPDLENVRRTPEFKQLLDRKWGKRQP